MAYFYVKSGGTKTTGSEATPLTGTWASALPTAADYYDNIKAVYDAGSPIEGDVIYVSDVHTHTYTAAVAFGGGAQWGKPEVIMSVDDTAIDEYKPGASEETTSGDFDFYGLSLWGLSLTASAGDMALSSTASRGLWAQDCTFTIGGTTDFEIQDRSFCEFINCTFDFGTVNYRDIEYYEAAEAHFYGCTFVSTGLMSYPMSQPETVGTYQTYTGCDLSIFDSGIVRGNHASAGYDNSSARVIGCKLSASISRYMNVNSYETFPKGECYVANSSSSSAAAEYQFAFENRRGIVEDNTAIYRDGSTAYPSGTKTSLEAITSTEAGLEQPFGFNFPTRYSALSDTASDTLRIYILSSAALTDADVYATAHYPDGTNKQTYNTATSSTEFLKGTTLTTNTETWIGRTAENRYQIDIDTSTAGGGDDGADCVPIIRVYVAKASATIYFCSEVDLV